MNEKDQLFGFLLSIRKKLRIQKITKQTQFALLFACLTFLAFVLFGRLFVTTYLLRKAILIAISFFIISFVFYWRNKPSMYDAAIFGDGFLKEDRLVTSLDYLEDTSLLAQLQRKETMNHLTKQKAEIKDTKLPLFDWKAIVFSFGALFVASILLLLPNDIMEKAKAIEQEELIVKETKDELKEELKKHEEEKPLILELEKLKDLQTQEDADTLLKELMKKENELNESIKNLKEKELQLKELADNSPKNSLANLALEGKSKEMQEQLNKLKENIANLNETEIEQFQKLVENMLDQKTEDISELSEDELLALLEQLEQVLENVASISDLQALQSALQATATNQYGKMAQSGLNPSKLTLSNSNTTNSSNTTAQTPGNSPSNNQQGNNASSGSGSGNGNGSGSGSGNGNGSGSGSGNGNGSGSGGSGAGTGVGDQTLTVPSYIDSESRIETDSAPTGEGESEFEETTNSPAIKGHVRTYDEVYSSYERSYRESVDRMNLPTRLEDIVKQYFSEMEPKGEN
ncbi:hypothetical protein [Sutcliffiella halmapala]|uniref:hypothetical protein n=1 Tax=Sutcliffiella halmapala TaxID=79882 RepID=UPI0014745055|nr:hypothetical protein [Sutcliffiella halmapala]